VKKTSRWGFDYTERIAPLAKGRGFQAPALAGLALHRHGQTELDGRFASTQSDSSSRSLLDSLWQNANLARFAISVWIDNGT
jgi:hypothetical protein